MVDIWKPEPSIGIEFHDCLGGINKAASVTRHQDWRTVCNSLVLCLFANLEPELILPLISSACGLAWELDDLLMAGEGALKSSCKPITPRAVGMRKQVSQRYKS
jgi:aldehyde:ferredoxin oxidoreductase